MRILLGLTLFTVCLPFVILGVAVRCVTAAFTYGHADVADGLSDWLNPDIDGE